MAEALQHEGKSQCKENDENMECAVCLQRCVHPAQLPCGHIFCFLCIKGFANQNKKCAMCRQEIPKDFIEQPNLLEFTCPQENSEGSFQWFYEGRNGWWRYDERANEEIEEAFKLELPCFDLMICGELYVIDLIHKFQHPKRDSSRKRSIKRDKTDNVVAKGVAGWWQYDERTTKDLENAYKNDDKTCELLIAGFLYIVDLENMLQIRRNDPSRRRRIKRDYSTIPKKGIAGLPTNKEPRQETPLQEPLTHQCLEEGNLTDSSVSVENDQSSQRQELDETLEMLDNLSLNTNRER